MNIENKTKNKDRQGLEIARTSERPTDAAGVSDQTGTGPSKMTYVYYGIRVK